MPKPNVKRANTMRARPRAAAKMDIDLDMAELKVTDDTPMPSTSTSSAEGPNKAKKSALKRSASMRSSTADKNNNRNSSSTKRVKPFIATISHEREAGSLHTFGLNGVGQIGIENAQQRKFPARVEGLENVKITQVAAGSMHCVVLTDDNKVYAFGCNDDFALGRATEDEDEFVIPGLVPLQENIIQVTAGDSHSAALTETGRLYIWGSFRNGSGDIGLQPRTRKSFTPTLISFASPGNTEPTIVKIGSGTNHVVALSSDGEVFGLGDGENGQLGRFVTARVLRSRTLVPRADAFKEPGKVIAPHMKNVCDIWAGGDSTICKTDKGEIWGFGLNASSQLGWPSRKLMGENQTLGEVNMSNCHFIPMKSESFNSSDAKPWKQFALGEHHVIALNEAGNVFALGDGRDGRLGLGDDMEEKAVPTIIPTLENEKCVHVACGGSTSYAITSSGKLYAWGFGENFQLANGSDDDANVPTLCRGSKTEDGITGRVVYVSAGSQHAAIITVLPNGQ